MRQKLLTATAIILVDSIDAVTGTFHISKEFIGIVIPLLSDNIVGEHSRISSTVAIPFSLTSPLEHVRAIHGSATDKLPRTLEIVVGSSIVSGLFVRFDDTLSEYSFHS